MKNYNYLYENPQILQKAKIGNSLKNTPYAPLLETSLSSVNKGVNGLALKLSIFYVLDRKGSEKLG